MFDLLILPVSISEAAIRPVPVASPFPPTRDRHRLPPRRPARSPRRQECAPGPRPFQEPFSRHGSSARSPNAIDTTATVFLRVMSGLYIEDRRGSDTGGARLCEGDRPRGG